MTDMYKLMQRQTESLADAPNALAELQRAVRGAADTLAASKKTVASAERSTARVETVIDELEEPLRALRASIERVNAVLSHPAVERIPATIALIEDTVVPIAEAIQRARQRWSGVTDAARRLAESARHGR